MENLSNFNNNEEPILKIEKRRTSRTNFPVSIFYPHINSIPLEEVTEKGIPTLEPMNISEGGICFKSRIELKAGDFMSFLLKVSDNPSFNCLAEVKWVDPEDSSYIIGCQFYSLSLYEVQIIKDYAAKKYSPTLL